ncbi:hypothetical protein ACA910_008911 [Epithemia clementina (nom. ined.)]
MAASTTSTLGDDDWKKISKLVEQFYNRPDAEPFREPVDWKSLGLYDYPKIITEPMDLGTVKKKLQKKEYKTLHQVGLDVRKIWANCQDYNQEGSDFHKLAGSLRKKWDDKFTKLLAESRPTTTATSGASASTSKGDEAKPASAETGSNKRPAGVLSETTLPLVSEPPTNTNQISTLAERKAFAKSLFSLSKEDLGKLLVEVEAKCPSALTRNAAEDEVELNVDKLSSALLLELSNYVSACVKPSKTTSSKKSSGGGGGGTNANKRTKTTKS